MQPHFSIIIPAHNEEDYIRKTLHNIKEQTYQNFEIVIVPNGCTDKTEEIISKRANEKLRTFPMSTANVSRARNYGAGKASGKMLIFLDADTLLAQDSLQKINKQFLEHHSVATTKVEPDISNSKYRVAMKVKNFYNQTKIYAGCSGILICRKEDFEQVNGYDPNIIVKEHKELIDKLRKKGQYTCIDTSVITSMRRFEKWGLSKATGFWIIQWFKNKQGKLSESKYEKIR